MTHSHQVKTSTARDLHVMGYFSKVILLIVLNKGFGFCRCVKTWKCEIKTCLTGRKVSLVQKQTHKNQTDAKHLPRLHTLFISSSHANWHRWSASHTPRANDAPHSYVALRRHSELKTRWHFPSWLAQTGRNNTLALAGLFFRASSPRQADFWQRVRGKSRPRISTNPWGEWEGAGRRWQGVGGGLSCDPDFCTSLCLGGQRRFSSFISLRAELLAVINTVAEGERERDRANRNAEKGNLWVVYCVRPCIMDYFWQRCKWDQIFDSTVSVISHSADLCCKGRWLCRRSCGIQVQQLQFPCSVIL